MIVFLLKEYLPLSLEEFPVAYRINVLRWESRRKTY
jgi:hypothetical protein